MKKTLEARLAMPEVLREPRRMTMLLKATSVRLDDETLKRVSQMVEAMDRPRAWLMAEAIKLYLFGCCFWSNITHFVMKTR